MLLSMGSHRVGYDCSDLVCMHALEMEMTTHSSIFCLENPRDGGAWWAAVCGVAQSQTRLKRLSSSSSSSHEKGGGPRKHPEVGLYGLGVLYIYVALGLAKCDGKVGSRERGSASSSHGQPECKAREFGIYLAGHKNVFYG